MWLTVDNIRVHVCLGIYEWESVIKRLVIIKVKIKVSDIIDYDSIALKIREFAKSRKFDYIEHFKESLKKHLMENFDTKELSLDIMKPSIISKLHYAKVSD